MAEESSSYWSQVISGTFLSDEKKLTDAFFEECVQYIDKNKLRSFVMHDDFRAGDRFIDLFRKAKYHVFCQKQRAILGGFDCYAYIVSKDPLEKTPPTYTWI
jgi:hypothetical protein